LDVRLLTLENVHFLKSDSLKGQTLDIFVGLGRVAFDAVNLPEKSADIQSLALYDPRVRILEFTGTPAPEPPSNPSSATPTPSPNDTLPWQVAIESFHLEGGAFALHNYRKAPVKTTPPEQLDYNHLEVFDIRIDIRDFTYRDWTFAGAVDRIALQDSSGFVLEELSAREALVSEQTVRLNGMKLLTPYSHLGDTLVLRYRAFTDFKEYVDRVHMEGKFNQAAVALRDIMVFAPALRRNPFFRSNSERVFELNGSVSGRVNRLRSKDLEVRLADRLFLRGRFRSRNLAVRDEQVVNLKLETLRTDMRTLRQLIPGFRPPENFERLGRIVFSGNFDGFFVDFVADGKLRTDLGLAEMDMRMNLKEGRDRAQYSGRLSLQRFDLGRWSANPNLGLVSLTSRVKQGVGLDRNTANAVLEAHIDSVAFKGYTYRNIRFDGQLNRSLLDGELIIQDENIDLSFLGEIDFTDTVPVFDFQANVAKLALQPLHLSRQPLELSGVVDLRLRNRRLLDMEGLVQGKDLRMIRAGRDTFHLGHLRVSANSDGGRKTVLLSSDILQAELTGVFDLNTLHKHLFNLLHRNHPEFARRLKLPRYEETLSPADFAFRVQLLQGGPFPSLLHPKLQSLEKATLKGYLASAADSLKIDLEVPALTFGEVQLVDVVLLADLLRTEGDINLGVFKTRIRDKVELAPITLLGLLEGDTLEFALTSIAFNRILDNLKINGAFFAEDEDFYRIRFYTSELVLFHEIWTINENNYLRIGPQTIETRDFIITNADRVIRLQSLRHSGLEIFLQNVDVAFVNDLWKYEPLNF
ncbi:MAG: hypothetical protein D6765_11745, partial [Bacteroidetes bacterium]